MRNKRMRWIGGLLATLVLVLGGCATLDEQQRKWIFQPSKVEWRGGAAAADGMHDRWIEFTPPGADCTGEAARVVAAAGRPRCAGDAVPARRPLGRDEQLVSHAPPARAGRVGAGGRLSRLRPQHRRAAVRDHRLRGRARRLGLAAPAAAGQAAADLRPLVGQRDRGQPRGRGRRRGGCRGRRRLHVGARCLFDDAFRLAAARAADHAALRRGASASPRSARRCWWCTARRTG